MGSAHINDGLKQYRSNSAKRMIVRATSVAKSLEQSK